jgi:hypothetical protein
MPSYESDRPATLENMQRLVSSLAYWMDQAGETRLAVGAKEAAARLTDPSDLEAYLLGIEGLSYYPTWIDEVRCGRLMMNELFESALQALLTRTRELTTPLWVANSRGNTLLDHWMGAALRPELILWITRQSYRFIDGVISITGENWKRPDVWRGRGIAAVDEFLAQTNILQLTSDAEYKLYFPARDEFNHLKRFYNAFNRGFPGQWGHRTHANGELVYTKDMGFAFRFRDTARNSGITVLQGTDIPPDS